MGEREEGKREKGKSWIWGCEFGEQVAGNTKGLAWLVGKPFSIRAGCIHDLVELGVAEPEYVKTDQQLADLHTKPLARLKLKAILDKLRLVEGRPVSSKDGETDRRAV